MRRPPGTRVIVVALVALIAGMVNPAPSTGSALEQTTHAATTRGVPAAAAGAPGLRFTAGLPLLDAGVSTGASEPSIKVDSRGHIYVTGPAGVPTGGCPFWRVHPDFQNAGGLLYDYMGTFDTQKFSAGGGDCDIAVGGAPAQHNFDNLAVSSLSVADLTVNQSADGGATFHAVANPAGNQTPGDDRQWNAADTGLGQVYLTVHDAATDNIQIATSTDGGYTYRSNVPAIQTTPNSCGIATGCLSAATMDNHFGNLVVNPRTHRLYTVYVAPASAAELAAAQQQGASPNEHVVYVAVGNPCAVLCKAGLPLGPISWTDHVVYIAPSGDDLAHIFPSIGIDAGGTVYIAWGDDPTLGRPNHIFVTHSANPDLAGSWSAPTEVDQGVSHSNMLPWIVGGAAGALDVVWYQAQLNGSVCPAGEPTGDASGVNNNCHDVWTTQFAQSHNANTAIPTFTIVPASAVIHRGSLCDQGLNCSLIGGDRTLADFFEVDLDPAGAANIAYAADAASPGTAVITYTRQCAGPSATSSVTIRYPCTPTPPPPPPPDSCNGVGVVSDPAGDASNPLGLPGGTGQVDITRVDFAVDPVRRTLTTTMHLASLSPLPIAGTASAYFYVAWTYPGTGKTYATLAVQPGPGSGLSYSYGEFDPSTNQLRASNSATGSMTLGTGGTISVTVPLTGVGSPAIPVRPGGTPAVTSSYALTFSGLGANVTGYVFARPDDRAPNQGYGSRWAICAPITPTPTPPPTVTRTPTPCPFPCLSAHPPSSTIHERAVRRT
jgi:hypothetical protein